MEDGEGDVRAETLNEENRAKDLTESEDGENCGNSEGGQSDEGEDVNRMRVKG